jgi:hypothetical protein
LETENIPEKGADDAVLVAPFRFAPVSHALGLGLQHLALLLGLAVYPLQRESLKGLIEQPWVLVLRRRR